MHNLKPTKLLIHVSIIVPTVILTFILPVLILFQPWLIKFEAKKHSQTLNPMAITTVVALNSLSKPHAAALLTAYSLNEQNHLLDVYDLLIRVKTTFAITLILLCLAVYWLVHTHRINDLFQSISMSGVISLFTVIAISGLLFFAWDSLFIGFHRAFFPQGNWAFPANSILITLYPDRFWFNVFGYYLILVLLLSLTLLSLSYIVKKFKVNLPT